MREINVPSLSKGFFIAADVEARIGFLFRIFCPSANRANLAIKTLGESKFSTARTAFTGHVFIIDGMR